MRQLLLKIDLQDGFCNDEVQIRVNGKPVFDQKSTTTKRLVGLADSAEVSIAPGPADVEISIPSRGLQWRDQVQVTDDLHLGVSIENGDVRCSQSKTPFGYA
jgi:hypothetical protein